MCVRAPERSEIPEPNESLQKVGAEWPASEGRNFHRTAFLALQATRVHVISVKHTALSGDRRGERVRGTAIVRSQHKTVVSVSHRRERRYQSCLAQVAEEVCRILYSDVFLAAIQSLITGSVCHCSSSAIVKFFYHLPEE
ncbi:hypothetical protein HA49_04940 [Tatumella morbirosei]|uniref:Uncharacterized protein n=1 Tax=Tatumella morbirosei TaxID=642227 RepID=A0A095TDT4_9GAMM|nr:hypothetical protein HA49_04940 [Tatumella morbirosei]